MSKIKNFLHKIKTDRKYYIEKFLKIRTKSGDLVSFKFNDAQLDSLKKIDKLQASKNKPIRVIWLKARQLGISTLCEGMIFQDTSTNKLKNSMIIAHEDKATQNLFSMSKLFYEELPPEIRPMKKYSNESALSFENPTNDEDKKYKNPGFRSKITVATAKNVDSGRSATINNLHASEVAFWDNAETLMLGLLQCVPDTPNSMVFIESTANGVGGWFYDFWKRSEAGETDYIPIFLSWFTNPEYSKPFDSESQKRQFIKSINATTFDDSGKEIESEEKMLRKTFKLTYEQLNWRSWCISNKCNGDIETFRQEYPSTPEEAFIVSGRPVFNIKALREYLKFIEDPIKIGFLNKSDSNVISIEENEKGYLSIWKEPESGRHYSIGADVAEGLGNGDYSCACVLDDDMNLVATWHGHIDPDLFGKELVLLGLYYNKAYLGVESNNHGLTTLKAIQREEYWDIYYQKRYDKVSDQITQKMGWQTSSRTKPLMIGKLAEFVREKWLWIKSKLVITELLTYVKGDDGKMNAQPGSHDDCVMSLAIALQLALEGLGETYEPEIPIDQDGRRYKEQLEDNSMSGEEIGLDNLENQEYSI